MKSLFGRDNPDSLKSAADARRRQVHEALARHPAFDGLTRDHDGASLVGFMEWCGKSVPIRVSCYRLEGIAELAQHYLSLQTHQLAMDEAARRYILDVARDPGSRLAGWLDAPAERFVAELALVRIALTEFGTYTMSYLSSLMGGLRLNVKGYAGEEISELELRGEGLKPGRMPLVLDGESFAIESAEFGIFVSTEEWHEGQQRWVYGADHLRVDYSLEIQVDEHSGEDGAPAPHAQVIPVPKLPDGHHPLPAELPGITVRDAGDDWEAWIGNDAPPIRANELTFGEWRDGRLCVKWRGEYGERRPFLFDGAAACDVIRIRVKAEGDADTFMRTLFGESRLRSLRREVGEWTIHPPSMPEDRRRWLDVKYFLAKD